MNKALISKVTLCLLTIIMIITLLQGFSFAQSENLQIVKKSEEQGKEEYMIYVSGLLQEKFEFAFSNQAKVEDKTTLKFSESALDKAENENSSANNIAYVDADLYAEYFKDKEETFLWIRTGETYKVEAEKIELANALSEEEVQSLNSITKKIKVELKEKELKPQTVNGVTITGKIGTINIEDDKTATYSYKIVKATEGTDANKLIKLVEEKMNHLDDKNIFEQLSIYNEFKAMYEKLVPAKNDKKWSKVNNYEIEQPQDSKTGDQYLVWIKKDSGENDQVIDVQIMTCKDTPTEKYEKQEVVIKETTKLPITGDNIILFVIAGVIILLIVAVVILKRKDKKETTK